MSDWNTYGRVTTKTWHTTDGSPKRVLAEVESYKHDDDAEDHDDDAFDDGASAKIHFSVSDGVATCDGIKDANSKAYHRIDFGPSIARTLAMAERAVSALPFIDDVESVEQQLGEALSEGFEATFED